MITKTIYNIIIILSIVGFILPSPLLAKEDPETAMPQTVGEAKDFGMIILDKLPDAVRLVWQEEALPILERMWKWVRPVVEPWRHKLGKSLDKEVGKGRLDNGLEKETEEIQKDLWLRFKNLIKQSI